MQRSHIVLGVLALFIGIIAGVCSGIEGDERFLGGSYDGYDVGAATNTTLQSALPRGTVFRCY